MVEEIFGPVLTVYVYEDDKYEETCKLIDTTTAYALTGSMSVPLHSVPPGSLSNLIGSWSFLQLLCGSSRLDQGL